MLLLTFRRFVPPRNGILDGVWRPLCVGIARALPPIGDGNPVRAVAGHGSGKGVRELIRRMSFENPLWGAPKVHGELLKLGVDGAPQIDQAAIDFRIDFSLM